MQTDIEISKEEDFARILQMEEEYIQHICEDIIRLKPDLLFTEKGISGTHTVTHKHTVTHSHTQSHTNTVSHTHTYGAFPLHGLARYG